MATSPNILVGVEAMPERRLVWLCLAGWTCKSANCCRHARARLEPGSPIFLIQRKPTSKGKSTNIGASTVSVTSWLLDTFAGYGYKPERAFLAYFLTVVLFGFIFLSHQPSQHATHTPCYTGAESEQYPADRFSSKYCYIGRLADDAKGRRGCASNFHRGDSSGFISPEIPRRLVYSGPNLQERAQKGMQVWDELVAKGSAPK
jgi:hypothetical protein